MISPALQRKKQLHELLSTHARFVFCHVLQLIIVGELPKWKYKLVEFSPHRPIPSENGRGSEGKSPPNKAWSVSGRRSGSTCPHISVRS